MPENDFPELDVALENAERLSREMQGVRLSAEEFSRSLSQGLKLAVAGGRDLDAIFRRLALSLSGRVLSRSLSGLEGLLSRSLSQAASGLAGALTGGSSGGPGLPVLPFARGGVVSRPSYFPMTNGAAGLMGEAGPEAILPLARGSDGRLGVRSGGEGGISVTLNVQATDAESFRRSEAQLAAMVARVAGRGRRGL